MATTTLDRYGSSRGSSNWLETAEALVDQGMTTGIKAALCGATQLATAGAAGFMMTTWGDKASVGGLPADLLAGLALTGVGALWEDEAGTNQYILSAGLGALGAFATRQGMKAAYEVAKTKAKAASQG